MLRIHHTRSVFQSSIYSRRMSRVAYCHFIVDNKRRCALFFRVDEHRDYISGSHRWTRRVNEPLFYANATRVNIIFLDCFCYGRRRRRLTPATFLSASNGERSLFRTAIIRHAPLSAPERRPPPILHVTCLFHGCVWTPRRRRGNEIAAARSINYKKIASSKVNTSRSFETLLSALLLFIEPYHVLKDFYEIRN